MNTITLCFNYVILSILQKRTFVPYKTPNIMGNKIIKYIQFSSESIGINSILSNTNQSQLTSKLLRYILTTTALILWIVFNICAIQYYDFQPYILVVMNLVLYFIIACMISSSYSDTPKKDSYTQDK